MKFSAVVLSVALAASQTSAFMAPTSVTRAVRPVFSSEMAEETSATTTTSTDDAPGTILLLMVDALYHAIMYTSS